jgi:GT2 family glycosyltransferase
MPGSSPRDSQGPRRRAILVVGMHRSGTSALTRILNLLGVKLGSKLMPANKDNRAGYWEHDDLVRLHDELLKELGSSWDDLCPLPADDLQGERTASLRTRILEVLARDFAEAPVWGFKDPRLCRLLPLWDAVCREFATEPHFVITLRHPGEVAGSLARRNGFLPEKSHLLWLEHCLRAERLTRGRPRSFVAYEKLLDDWRPEMARVVAELGVEGLRSLEAVGSEVDAFLNPKLRHHVAAPSVAAGEAAALGRWVGEAYAALQRAAAGDSAELAERLDAITAQLETAGELFHPVLAQQKRDLAAAEQLVREREAKIALMRRRLAELVQGANAGGVPASKAAQGAPAGGEPETLAGNPRVSIVIPVWNRLDFTVQCVESLIEHTPAGLFEVVFVDNGSTDDTPQFLECLEGNVKVVRNEENLGFARACNQGAEVAVGDHLLFLNNDIEAQPGWLEPLLETVDRDPSVAAVGSKLLFPDRTIQHAGVAVIQSPFEKTGITVSHIHYKAHPDVFAASFACEYQALTAACLLVRRSAFAEVSGFDTGFWNGYEDMDLCFKLRERGGKLVYQPRSVLIHHESQSGPERFARTQGNIQLLWSRWLGKVSPDFLVDESERCTLAATNQIRAYLPPPVPARSEKGDRLTSIVILNRNRLSDLRQCLDSIAANTPERHEIIVIDNGSTDGSREYLHVITGERENLRVVVNAENIGFAAGNNQGIALAGGDGIVILNNDTAVTDGWLARLWAALDAHPETGIVGPMTNYASGPQVIPKVPYKNAQGLARFARRLASDHVGESEEARRIVAFCWLMRREVVERIGGFDEHFGTGNCEDDDYCVRTVQAGLRTRIARDVFVHHTGSQTFRAENIDYGESLRNNFEIFKRKWGMRPEVRPENGYPFYELAARPAQPKIEVPDVSVTHEASQGGRWFEGKGAKAPAMRESRPIAPARHPAGAASTTAPGTMRLRIGLVGSAEPNAELRRLLKKYHGGGAVPVWRTTADVHANLREGGDVLLLAPDVVLSDEVLRILVAVASSNARVAAVGPVANLAPEPQLVKPRYDDLGKGLRKFAARRAKKYRDTWKEVPHLGEFCLLLKGGAAADAGGLDESAPLAEALARLFARLRAKEYRVACAHGAYVHRGGGGGGRADEAATRESAGVSEAEAAVPGVPQ